MTRDDKLMLLAQLEAELAQMQREAAATREIEQRAARADGLVFFLPQAE